MITTSSVVDILALINLQSLPKDLSAADARTHPLAAKELAQVCVLSEGDLSTLPGGREALFICLGRLTRTNLLGVHVGVLGNPDIRRAALHQIPKDLRLEALGLPKQMPQALDQRLAQELVREPLLRIVMLLSDSQTARGC